MAYLDGIDCGEWQNVLAELAEWADEALYVSETPDFWTELKNTSAILEITQTAEASNGLFTTAEQIEIASRLDAIKDLVREKFELTAEQISLVDDRLDEMKEASERVGRKDWVLMLYGSLVSIFVAGAVPSAVIQAMLTAAAHGVAHIFGFGDPPWMITT